VITSCHGVLLKTCLSGCNLVDFTSALQSQRHAKNQV
jgi:hypothetical protein